MMEVKEDKPDSAGNKNEQDIENATCSDNTNLSEMFDNGLQMFNDINNSSEALRNPKVQSDIKRVMNIFENVTRLVSIVDMFSSNESFEEIPTENIKYFLLPALLGTLTTKICTTDNRLHILDVAEVYFVDFLKRLKEYELIDMEIPDLKHEDKDENSEETTIERQKSNADMITEMVNARNTKIQRYKDQKELEKKLETLKKCMDNPSIEDETKREYFVTLLKTFVNQAIDELSSLATERQLLKHMEKIGHSSDANKKQAEKRTPKFQPIIITRDVMQKKVFGAGYPSLPVMTVEEFYDKKVKDGEWPEQAQRNKIGNKSLQDMASGNDNENLEKDREEEENERKIENDDDETLARARAMDEYKDTHKRGWGNRYNRS